MLFCQYRFASLALHLEAIEYTVHVAVMFVKCTLTLKHTVYSTWSGYSISE